MEEKKIDRWRKLYDGGSTLMFLTLLHAAFCPTFGLIYVMALSSALTLIGYAKMDKEEGE